MSSSQVRKAIELLEEGKPWTLVAFGAKITDGQVRGISGKWYALRNEYLAVGRNIPDAVENYISLYCGRLRESA